MTLPCPFFMNQGTTDQRGAASTMPDLSQYYNLSDLHTK